jgi:hypothetical protein
MPYMLGSLVILRSGKSSRIVPNQLQYALAELSRDESSAAAHAAAALPTASLFTPLTGTAAIAAINFQDRQPILAACVTCVHLIDPDDTWGLSALRCERNAVSAPHPIDCVQAAAEAAGGLRNVEWGIVGRLAKNRRGRTARRRESPKGVYRQKRGRDRFRPISGQSAGCNTGRPHFPCAARLTRD